MQKVLILTGVTGVGKTKLSIEIAKKFNGINKLIIRPNEEIDL